MQRLAVAFLVVVATLAVVSPAVTQGGSWEEECAYFKERWSHWEERAYLRFCAECTDPDPQAFEIAIHMRDLYRGESIDSECGGEQEPLPI